MFDQKIMFCIYNYKTVSKKLKNTHKKVVSA